MQLKIKIFLMQITSIVTEDTNEMKYMLDLCQGKMQIFSPCNLTELLPTLTKKMDIVISVLLLFPGPPNNH